MIQKKIVFVTYGGGHVKIIAPLYQAWKDKYDITIVALTSAGNYLANENIPFVRISDFDGLVDDDAIRYGKLLLGNAPDTTYVPLKESILYHGVSFKELVVELGSEALAKDEFDKKGRACFLPVKAFTEILKVLQPDIVIATNAPRAERASLIASKSLGIPNMCINDNLWIKGGAQKVAELNCVDLLCVLTKGVKRQLVSLTSFPQEKIMVTGTPVFDKIKLVRNDRPKETNDNRVVVLLADCDLPKQHVMYENKVSNEFFGDKVRQELNYLGWKNNWNIIFRPHPSQKYDYSNYKNIEISKLTDDLHELLLTVNVIVTAISTVGIEGKVLGTGLVSLEGTVYESGGSYSKLGLSTGVHHERELEEAIRKELDLSKSPELDLYSGMSLDNLDKCVEFLLNQNKSKLVG